MTRGKGNELKGLGIQDYGEALLRQLQYMSQLNLEDTADLDF